MSLTLRRMRLRIQSVELALGFPKRRLNVAAKLLNLMSNLLNLLRRENDATVGEEFLGLLRIENEDVAFANSFFDEVAR